MNEYAELVTMLLETPDTDIVLELNVAESSLRRGLKTALKEQEQVRAILELPDLYGSITIARSKEKDNVFTIRYVTEEVKPKVRFTILGTGNQSNDAEDY